jgi:hypothetical protein
MQLEFPFVKPFDDVVAAIKQREAEYCGKFNAMLNKFFPNRVSISEIFKDLPPIDFSDGPSIPMTLVLGPIGQYEFEFAKQMTRDYWSGFTVEFNTDETKSH